MLEHSKRNVFVAGLAAATLLTALPGCGKKSEDAIAVVNGDPITVNEYHDYMERKAVVMVQTPQGPVTARVAGSLGFQALQDVINRRIIMQAAKDQGVAPTDATIEKELAFRTKQNPMYVKSLTAAGMTLIQIRDDLALDLARSNLLTKGITITKDDIDSFIKDNPSEFTNPATADLYWIVLKDAKKKTQVDQDLKAGQSFPTVAARYSDDPNARRTNGAVPSQWRVVDSMPPILKGIVTKTSEHTASDWIKDGGNSVKIYVEKKTKAQQVPIDDDMREQVRRRLGEIRGSQANDLNKSLGDRLKTATIDIKVDYLRDAWKKAMDDLKSQDAQSPVPPAPGAAGATTK